MAVGNLKLPWWAEPFAVALGDLVLDIPFDILGIKLIWWTWHDTDPNIFDRTYSVPWTRWVACTWQKRYHDNIKETYCTFS